MHRLALLSAAPLLLAAHLRAAAPDPWMFIVLPDTQYYSDSAGRYPQFLDQTSWIVEHQSRLNIAFVSHIGDIVQNGLNGGSTVEWDRMEAGLDILQGVLPYAVCIGNHDYNTVSNKGSGATPYTTYFGPARYEGMPWYGGASPNSQNHYQRFFAGGREYLHLALEWQPDAAALAWAQSILDAIPALPTIISTHEHIQDGDGSGAGAGRSGPGNITWATLVRANPRIFMVVNGHFHRGLDGHDGEHHLDSRNDAALSVFEMLSDYQNWASGGSGYLRTIRFDELHGVARVRTFSPTLNRYETDADSHLDFALDFGARFDGAAPWQATRSFARDVDGYTSVQDTQISQSSPTTPAGSDISVSIDSSDPSSQPTQALIRFDDILGDGPGQIPHDSDIIIAKLHIAINNAGSGFTLHQMLVPWTETVTWDALGAGVTPDGLEALAAPEAVAGAGVASGLIPIGLFQIDVTSSLRAYLNGSPNHGWAMLPFPGGTDGTDFRTSEQTNPILRPTLVVTTTAEPVQIASFREGATGYTGARDVELRQADPDTASGEAPSLSIDSDEPIETGGDTQVLLAFDGIIGAAPGMIPPSARITSAMLKLAITDEGSGFTLHRMSAEWSESSTWNSLVGGVTADDSEAGISAEAAIGINSPTANIRNGIAYVDVTESLQAWITGEVNRGWVLRPFNAGSNGIDIASSEHADESLRPMLIVRYQVPPPSPCPGDADADRDRDFADITAVLANFGLLGDPFRPGDADGDGDVDFNDVTAVLAGFGVPCD